MSKEVTIPQEIILSKIYEIRNKVSGQEDQIALIFEYLNQLEQAKQKDLEQESRKKIGFKQKGE